MPFCHETNKRDAGSGTPQGSYIECSWHLFTFPFNATRAWRYHVTYNMHRMNVKRGCDGGGGIY